MGQIACDHGQYQQAPFNTFVCAFNRPTSMAELMEHTEINALLDKAYDQRGNNIHGSIELAMLALERCDDVQYRSGKAKAETYLGLFYLVQAEFDVARKFTESALAYFTETNDAKGIADANYNLASIFYRSNDYHKGLQTLLESLKCYRQLNDLRNQARVLIPIGTIFEYFGDYQNAATVYQQCIEISKEINDLNQESNAYTPLCGIYIKRNEVEKALDLIEKSISIKKETGDNRGLAYALYTRGKAYLRKKDLDSALNDFSTALSMTTEANDRLGQGMVLNKMGTAYFEKKDFGEARKFFLKAEEVAQKFNVTFVLARAHHNMYELCKAENNPSDALKYLERSIAMKNAVANKETYNIINTYDALLKIEVLEHNTRLQKEKTSIIEKKNSELDSFFYRVSHDLKGPIASLLGLHNIVQLDIKDQAARAVFDLYHGQVMRMNNIVMGLINLIETRNTNELRIKIDFEKLVEECIQSCHYLDQSAKVNFRKEIAQVEYCSEWAIINTILQNLIENSIKYARPEAEPFVDIRIFACQQSLVIRVEDNGQGIAEEQVGLIFNMFYRANTTAKGSGLGLYILNRAVERLQGTVEVTSKLHEGSVFTVKLPLP